MQTTLLVTAPGALTLVQDLGRRGWRRYGVPGAGALDGGLLRIANVLAGNAEGAAALEFFLAGPTLQAVDAPVQLALAGDFAVTLQRGGERTALASWRSITLQPGDALRVGQLRSGRIGYIAAAGLVVPPLLGSAATYTRARLGGVAGRALAAGDKLTVAALPHPLHGASRAERVLPHPPAADAGPIRVVPGPQDDHFDATAWAAFLGATYRVSRDADRMGVRLEGAPPLQHRPDKGAEIVSDAAVPGSIQVPGNGMPIVLLADGQTVGGYPKIATVASADLARLASLPVGAPLRFATIGVAAAEALACAHEAGIRRHLAAIAPLTLVDGIDLAALGSSNLVSGMIDAQRPDPGRDPA